MLIRDQDGQYPAYHARVSVHGARGFTYIIIQKIPKDEQPIFHTSDYKPVHLMMASTPPPALVVWNVSTHLSG
jgi:hypothetical protein